MAPRGPGCLRKRLLLTVRLVRRFLGLPVSVVIIFSIPAGSTVLIQHDSRLSQIVNWQIDIHLDLRRRRLLTVVAVIALVGGLCVRLVVGRLKGRADKGSFLAASGEHHHRTRTLAAYVVFIGVGFGL